MRGNWPLAGGVALIRSLIPADTRSRIFCSWAEVIRLFATALSRRVLTAAVSACSRPTVDFFWSLATAASDLPDSSCLRSWASVRPRYLAAASIPAWMIGGPPKCGRPAAPGPGPGPRPRPGAGAGTWAERKRDVGASLLNALPQRVGLGLGDPALLDGGGELVESRTLQRRVELGRRDVQALGDVCEERLARAARRVLRGGVGAAGKSGGGCCDRSDRELTLEP